MSFEQENHQITRRFSSFSEIISFNSRHYPDEVAFIEGEQRTTWKQFDERVSQFASLLGNAGGCQGDRLAFLANSSMWAYEVMFAITRLGAVQVPFSTLLQAETLRVLIKDCRPKLLLVGTGLESLAEEAVNGLDHGLRPKLLYQSCDFLDEKLQHSDMQAPEEVSVHDWCNIIYSSGTTGMPKGIVHSHSARLHMGQSLIEELDISRSSRSVLATPPYSNGTLICLLPTMLAGGASIIMPRFDVDDFFTIARKQAPTHVLLVPTQYQRIMEHAISVETDLSSFQALMTAGAPMPPELKETVRTKTNEHLYEIWGVTEGVATIIKPNQMRDRMQSVGLPLARCTVKLIDEENNTIPGPGVGEIVGTSMFLMEGYLDEIDKDETTHWHHESGQAYHRTGDIGEIDEDGYLSIRGRKKDIIISGGINIYPVDIESILRNHQDVIDAAVFGVPDQDWGEVPVACVVVRAENSINEEALKEWANNRLAKYQRLKELKSQNHDFPRNSLGKVLKNQLREANVMV